MFYIVKQLKNDHNDVLFYFNSACKTKKIVNDINLYAWFINATYNSEKLSFLSKTYL